jgi:hypothetical protein
MHADLERCRVLVTPVAEWNRKAGSRLDVCQQLAHDWGHLLSPGRDHGAVMASPARAARFGRAHRRQLVNLDRRVVTPQPLPDWRAKPHAGGEGRR